MRPRQDLITIFSSYILIETDRFSQWLTDPRLKQSQIKAFAQSSDTDRSKHVWAIYWHQLWPTHRLAQGHLLAYLQEAAYWSAQKLTSRFTFDRLTFGDCFQIAFLKLDKLLSSFQSDRGASLESFAKHFFGSTIRNELRRLHVADLCGDWLLLRKTSKKRFIESLQMAGLSKQIIEQYRLAWVCFKHLYGDYQADGIQQLPKPSDETWQAIAVLYNQEKLTQLTSPGPTISAHDLDTWLTDCIGYLRKALNPPTTSLNAPIPGSEAGQLQDNLQTDELTPLENLVQIAEKNLQKNQQHQLRQVVENCISTLPATDQSLLQLYYGGQFTQQQIAAQLNIKQYAVSRKLTRLRKTLLDELIAWRQQELGGDSTDVDIKTKSDYLELWLNDYFEPPQSD
ncbi:sigma-70 family RNA polymerase sigma factor [Leptolyngbya cf. ectocarpi LEGE 11479]|uniref:Sigma-70 family RNA polymerase sigma factor n=1 Tax=Leptolyngbya cf. ectocarpi LEGE 11479 TaxID=1828722 RepID=A0A928ZWD0_LEPEC|nr:sigma-70 family RNA polymerase sigma factor [Leptolyngbya ectocarpi]MBE9068654.1 sigma-70 family RNA polymerase sigma factor [Leptolyngbya cf. ectocarpi LEGE 11479]